MWELETFTIVPSGRGSDIAFATRRFISKVEHSITAMYLIAYKFKRGNESFLISIE